MSSKKKSRFFRTVTFRLTFWNAALFSTLSMAAFGWAYLSLLSNLNQRLDRGLLDDLSEFEALYTEKGSDALQREFVREADADGSSNVFMELLSPQGKVLAASDLTSWEEISQTSFLPNPQDHTTGFRTLSLTDREHRTRTVFKQVRDENILRLGKTMEENEILMERLREIFGTALAVMILLGGVVGRITARRAMAGVERVTRTATHIGRGRLSRRVPLGNEGEEIEALAQAFNGMLERIDVLVSELQEVIHNVAHDLRSPLTRIRGIAETTLTGRQDLSLYQEMTGTVVEECDRLVGLIQTLLEIAEADARTEQIPMTPVDMTALIRDAIDLFDAPAGEKGIRLEQYLPESPLFTSGDPPRLQRAIANLLDNAIKYTPPGGKVTLTARGEGDQIVIEIIDTGIGIAKEELPRIFDRFYRIDRSRTTPGNGLGLSLARSILKAHGGRITVSSSPGNGSIFALRLPRQGRDNNLHESI